MSSTTATASSSNSNNMNAGRIMECFLWLATGFFLEFLWSWQGGQDVIGWFTGGSSVAIMTLNNNETTTMTTTGTIIGTQQSYTNSSFPDSSSSEHYDESVAELLDKDEGPSFVNTPYRFNSSIKCLFVIGLEGTGHHLMQWMVSNGPMDKRVKHFKADKQRSWIHQYLLHAKPEGTGLWDAHCAQTDINTNQKRDFISKKLQGVNHRVASEQSDLIYFINTVDPFVDFGMVSYPNYNKQCRFLDYPNLDLWYELCDMAQVDCEHVYMYRDPYRILQSTTIKRHFNPTIMSAIGLYTTMYHIVATQLETYKDRTIGCFGFYENTTASWWEGIRELTGWGNSSESRDDYKAMIDDLYHPSATNQSWYHPNLDRYLTTLLELHERVIDLCRTSLEENQRKRLT